MNQPYQAASPESQSAATCDPRLAVVASLKSWGGIEGKIVTLFEEFIARGIMPELIRIRGGEVPYPDRMPNSVKSVVLSTHSKRDGIPAIIRYLRANSPSAVLTAKDHAAQVVLLARLLGRIDVPVFVKVTNTLSHVARRRVQRFMIRRLYPRADRLIANSRGVAEDLEASFGIPRDRITVIYNPTVTNELESRAAEKVSHPWFSRRDGPPLILSVGRLTPQKDFQMLLEAFSRVREERDCRLVILGEGAEREDLEARARILGVEKYIDMPGFVPDVLPYMARANVFALSSRYEGLSNVLIEALAVGTPAIATDCPSGSAEILEDGRYGRLVPVGDVTAMADAIRAELDAPTPQFLLRQAAERFRAGPIAEQYLRAMSLLPGETAVMPEQTGV